MLCAISSNPDGTASRFGQSFAGASVSGRVLSGCAVVLTVLAVFRFLVPAGPADAAMPAFTREVAGWDAIRQDGHLLVGSGAGPTMLVFSDFECPFCRRFSGEVLPRIEAELGQRVTVRFRHLPLPQHLHAYPAARAAECAGAQGAFKSFHDRLFLQTPSVDWSPDVSVKLAASAGVADTLAFRSCVTELANVPTIDRDSALARRIGVTGTPAVIIEGVYYLGGLTPETALSELRRHLEQERGRTP